MTPVSEDKLDPDMRRFADTIAAAYRAYPPFQTLSLNEARAVAEVVRKPWREGGPVMATTEEDTLPTSQGNVRIRIYRPVIKRMLPALIYLHGGGWKIFSLDTHDRLMREYAARAQIAVIGVDYALAPEARFPIALKQVLAVTSELARKGAALHIDGTRLALGGDSAGANLSLAAALALGAEGLHLLRGLLLLYGVYDNSISDLTAQQYGGPAYMLNTTEMADFWENYLAHPEDSLNPLARPILASAESLKKLPPVHMNFGACDILAEQSRAMAARLIQAGVTVSEDVCSGAPHSFLEAVSISQTADKALQTGAQWLQKRLQNNAGTD